MSAALEQWIISAATEMMNDFRARYRPYRFCLRNGSLLCWRGPLAYVFAFLEGNLQGFRISSTSPVESASKVKSTRARPVSVFL